jgi:hypothetical protein
MKSFLLFFLPLLAVVGLIAPASGTADAGVRTGSVVGVVTLPNGAPAADVPVVIEVTSGGVVMATQTRTDRAGRYGFRNLPAGQALVASRHRGLQDSARFALRAGTVTRVHLQLHR